ncbi:MAG: hypothetical protein M3431_01445 [Actinomycetota bacterium]|nr:hypothetical protein [Actinomycetota bacterium]
MVGRWIIANATRIPSLSMGQVAAECGVSDTTVLRLCRRVGFRGFTDLKFRVIEDGARALAPEPGLLDGVHRAGASVAATVFEHCIQGLRDTLRLLDDSLDRAVDLVDAAITGMPGSPITSHADVSLASIATELRTEAVVGRVVQIALASALARAYAERHPSDTSAAEIAAYDAVIDKTL